MNAWLPPASHPEVNFLAPLAENLNIWEKEPREWIAGKKKININPIQNDDRAIMKSWLTKSAVHKNYAKFKCAKI